MSNTVIINTGLPKFTTVKYTTKDDENITATKKDGIVTLVGDKNGTRELPLDDFIKKELPNNLANIKLENTPKEENIKIPKNAEITDKPLDLESETKQMIQNEEPEIGKKLDITV